MAGSSRPITDCTRTRGPGVTTFLFNPSPRAQSEQRQKQSQKGQPTGAVANDENSKRKRGSTRKKRRKKSNQIDEVTEQRAWRVLHREMTGCIIASCTNTDTAASTTAVAESSATGAATIPVTLPEDPSSGSGAAESGGALEVER